MAQERVILNSETALINSTEAILVRTAETPDIVKVLFNVPMTRLVCTKYVRRGYGRNSHMACIRYAEVTTHEADTVKLSFRKLPSLGGTEEETFLIKARQRRLDGENVVYDMTTLKSTAEYDIIKKGKLGYDSFAIQLKK
jgi:hypothetical protein